MMVLDEKSEYHQINYCVEDRYVHFKFHVNLSKKKKEILQDKWKLWPAGNATKKSLGSLKSVGFITWGPCTSLSQISRQFIESLVDISVIVEDWQNGIAGTVQLVWLIKMWLIQKCEVAALSLMNEQLCTILQKL